MYNLTATFFIRVGNSEVRFCFSLCSNLRVQYLVKYLMQARCFEECFCGLYRSYSVHCTIPTKLNLLYMKHLQLHWDDNVDICLDVFLVCFIQNEDENRASESKKTKLEEKAPSGHKTSSSREWVPWLFSTWKLGVIKKTDLPPFPSLHNSVSSLLFDG